MAYSPVEQGRLLKNPALGSVARDLGVTPAQVALAWTLRSGNATTGGTVLSIPKAGTAAHVRENRAALDLTLEDGLVQVNEACSTELRADLLASGFLGAVPLRDIGTELEGWVLDRREQLAGQLQDTLLNEAQRCPERRAQLTEQAWQVPGAPLPDARTLARFLCLCGTGTEVERLARQDLAELTDGWLTPGSSRAEQALLAWWLDGGLVQLEGNRGTIMVALTALQRTLEGDGFPVHRLTVRSDLPAQTLKDLISSLVRDSQKTQTIILDAPALQSDQAQQL